MNYKINLTPLTQTVLLSLIVFFTMSIFPAHASVPPTEEITATMMAGVLISYTNSTGSALINEDVTACDGLSVNQARFIVLDDDADNMTVSLNLPPGIFYEPGSVSVVTTSGGLTVAEVDIADLNMPVFSVSPGDLVAGNSLTLQWARQNGMTCDAYDSAIAGGVFKDSISVMTNLGVTEDVDPGVNSYNLLFASLSLAGADPITTIVGSTVSRDVIITNGGFGFLSGYSFTINDGSGTMTTSLVTANGTPIVPSSTSGTASTYTITPAIIAEYGNLDTRYDNAEQMTFTRTYTVLSCDNASSYRASWGCPDACMLTTLLPQQTNIANGVPNIDISWTTVTPQGTCVDAEYQVTYTNNGSGGAAGTAFDLDFQYATDRYAEAPYQVADFRDLYDFNINGRLLTVTQDGVTTAGGGSLGTTDHPYIVAATNFDNDLDGTGGLEDLDGDGQFDDLAVGQSVTVTFSSAYECDLICDVRRFSTPDAVITYEDQCEVEVQENRATGTLTNHGSPLGTNTGPPDIQDNEPFSLEVCTEHQYGGFSCPTNEMIMNFTLPTGMTALSGTRNGNPATLTIDGNVVSFEVVYSRVNCWELELVFDCAVNSINGPISIPYELTYSCDETCCTETWVCGEFITNAHCPGTEPCPGVFNSGTSLDRTNFGWTSQDLSTPVDPATLPRVNRKRALPCDTLLLTANGVQGGSHDNLFIRYEFGTITGNLPALNFQDGTGNLEITDASSSLVHNCPAPAPAMSVSGGITTCLWDLSSLIGSACLPPGFTFDDGDTYIFTADFVVTDNAGVTTTATQIPNTLTYFYNLDTDGTTQLFCDDYRTEMSPFRVSTSSFFADKINNGCTEYGAGGVFRLGNFPLGTDNFENEFRPWARIDAYEVTINTGDVYNPAVTPTFRANGGIGTGPAVTINLPPPTITGNVLRWENDGTWPFADISAAPYEEYFFNYGLITSCASTSGTLVNRIEYVDNFYLGEDSECADALVFSTNQSVTLNNRPNLVMANLTGEVQANSFEEFWDVQLFNNTNLDAPFPWLALEDNPEITIQRVVDLSDNSELTPMPYADGTWYQLGGTSGDPIAGTQEREYRIFYSTTSCELQELDAISGWDCIGYPTDPTTYPCVENSVVLATTGLISEVQIELTDEPTPPLNLCSPLDYEVILNSAQAADLDNPVVGFVLVSGLMVNGDVSVTYPNAGTGTVETVSYTTSGDTVFVNLEEHSSIGPDGLPGTVSALSAAARNALIDISFITDCDFESGATIQVLGFGDRPCGGKANNNGVRVLSSESFIDGAERPYLANIEFEAGISPAINCDDFTVDLDVVLIGLVAEMTSIDDTLEVVLQQGLTVDPASFVNNGGLTLSSTTINANGSTVLKIAMPSTPIDLSNGAVQLMASFTAGVEQSSGCNITKEIRAAITNTISGLACASAPGMVCGDTKIILGETRTTIELEKTDVTLNGDLVACTIAEDVVAIVGSLDIANQDLPADGSLLVEFFCADAAGQATGTSIGSYTFDGPVSAGTNVPFETEVPMSCDPANGILVSISNEQNCICASTAALLEIGEQVTAEAGDIQTLCSTTPVDLASLAATVTPVTIGASWTSSGNGTFDDGNGAFGIATTYTFGPEDIRRGEVILTLTTDDPADAPISNAACQIASDNVVITILKVDCGLFPWDGE